MPLPPAARRLPAVRAGRVPPNRALASTACMRMRLSEAPPPPPTLHFTSELPPPRGPPAPIGQTDTLQLVTSRA